MLVALNVPFKEKTKLIKMERDLKQKSHWDQHLK